MKKKNYTFVLRLFSVFALLVFVQLKAMAGYNITTTVTGSPFCACATTTINYNAVGVPLLASNVFTVQLSDATGSFASPVTIGTLISTTSTGSISVTIPCNTLTGTGYRMRTNSSSMAVTGQANSTDITINAAVTPTVNISVSPNDTLCGSQSATFGSSLVNGGPSPSYQWYKNGNPVGGNSGSYTDGSPANGDVYYLTITSNATCANPATATSASITMVVSNGSNFLAGNIVAPESMSVNVTGLMDVRYATDCDLMVTILPSGAAPLSGSTTVKVTEDAAVGTYNLQPYLTRHFDIEPVNNAANATATITLYAYQSEFDVYNLAATAAGWPLLPTGAVDNGNVRITQFHGTGTAPGNYTGSEGLIVPVVTWDAVHNWWAMVFPVIGFSGFYIHTAYGHPLDITLSNIAAQNDATRNRIEWASATETKGSVYTIQHSADGANFNDIGNVAAIGTPSAYTYWDEKPFNGVNYYRIKLSDANGNSSFTRVVNATVKNGSNLNIAASPNPVRNSLNVTVYGTQTGNSYISITDITGKELKKVQLNSASASIDLSGLVQGIYMLKYSDDVRTETTRIVKAD